MTMGRESTIGAGKTGWMLCADYRVAVTRPAESNPISDVFSIERLHPGVPAAASCSAV